MASRDERAAGLNLSRAHMPRLFLSGLKTREGRLTAVGGNAPPVNGHILKISFTFIYPHYSKQKINFKTFTSACLRKKSELDILERTEKQNLGIW